MQPQFAHLYAAEARNCSSPTRISDTVVQTVSYKDLSFKDATPSTGDDVLAEHSPRAESCSPRTRTRVCKRAQSIAASGSTHFGIARATSKTRGKGKAQDKS